MKKAYFEPEEPAVAIAATHISKMQKGNVICQAEKKKKTLLSNVVLNHSILSMIIVSAYGKNWRASPKRGFSFIIICVIALVQSSNKHAVPVQYHINEYRHYSNTGSDLHRQVFI